MAEGVGFEPTYRLLTDNSISSRARYGHFATPPQGKAEPKNSLAHFCVKSNVGPDFFQVADEGQSALSRLRVNRSRQGK